MGLLVGFLLMTRDFVVLKCLVVPVSAIMLEMGIVETVA